METSIFPSSQSSSCDLLLFLLISHTSGEAGLGSYHEYPYKIRPNNDMMEIMLVEMAVVQHELLNLTLYDQAAH